MPFALSPWTSRSAKSLTRPTGSYRRSCRATFLTRGGIHEHCRKRAAPRGRGCGEGADSVPAEHPHGPCPARPPAGSLFTFSSRGGGAPVGFLVAWGFMLAEPIVAPLLYLIFGNELAANLNSHFGWPTWLWAPFAVVAGLVVGA